MEYCLLLQPQAARVRTQEVWGWEIEGVWPTVPERPLCVALRGDLPLTCPPMLRLTMLPQSASFTSTLEEAVPCWP